MAKTTGFINGTLSVSAQEVILGQHALLLFRAAAGLDGLRANIPLAVDGHCGGDSMLMRGHFPLHGKLVMIDLTIRLMHLLNFAYYD